MDFPVTASFVLRRSQPFSVAAATAAAMRAGVTVRRRFSETKNVSVPVSWHTGVPAARASATFFRSVSRTRRAEEPFASRRRAFRRACSASSGKELDVS